MQSLLDLTTQRLLVFQLGANRIPIFEFVRLPCSGALITPIELAYHRDIGSLNNQQYADENLVGFLSTAIDKRHLVPMHV